MDRNLVVIATIAVGLITPAAPLQARERQPAPTRYSASPITPGFWAWARKKAVTAAEITELCREGLAIQFSNGRYLTLRLGPAAPAVIDRGHCTFNRKTQAERCELTVTETPGETKKGVMETRYSRDADGTLKMTVTGTTTEGPGAPHTETFDVFPVRCPDDTVHELLTTTFPAK